MRGRGTGSRTLLVATILLLTNQFAAPPAKASTAHRKATSPGTSHHLIQLVAARSRAHFVMRGKTAGHAHRYAGGGLSCVPFARSDSGIDVAGNAWEWWDNAAGLYARGSLPEPGSVLAFRANGRMRLGHVAVVSRVVNPREVEIDQANWWSPGMRGGVSRSVPVVDVSEANDWTAVRVGLGEGGKFGSVYPTYGFIYDRPDNGMMLAAAGAPTPAPELNPAPNDLRPAAEKDGVTEEQVAEAPLVVHRRSVHHVAARHVQRTATQKQGS